MRYIRYSLEEARTRAAAFVRHALGGHLPKTHPTYKELLKQMKDGLDEDDPGERIHKQAEYLAWAVKFVYDSSRTAGWDEGNFFSHLHKLFKRYEGLLDYEVDHLREKGNKLGVLAGVVDNLAAARTRKYKTALSKRKPVVQVVRERPAASALIWQKLRDRCFNYAGNFCKVDKCFEPKDGRSPLCLDHKREHKRVQTRDRVRHLRNNQPKTRH